MPFKPNADINFPAGNPDVELRFSGLLLLIPTTRTGQDTNCVVGALQAPQHVLKIVVVDRGTLSEVPTPTGRPITTPVRIFSADAGVTKYVSTEVATPFPGIEGNNLKDFRWSVDLKALHQNATSATTADRLKLAVTLTDGLLFTAIPTNPGRLAIMLRRPNGSRTHLNRIAAELGAFIRLGDAQGLTLEWNDQGNQRLQLMKGGGSGQGYVVRIDNLPSDPTEHDDFEAYYDFAIDTNDPRFGLDFYRRIGAEGGENVDAPCFSGTMDGDGRNG